MKEILYQQYFGAQFIALAGRFLNQQRADDSNTTMTFDSRQQRLVGETFQDRFKLSLNLTDLSLILSEGDSSESNPQLLTGNTRVEAFTIFHHMIVNKGIYHYNLKHQLHYDLPDHPLHEMDRFTYEDQDFIKENIKQRHNAEMILRDAVSEEQNADPVRIWPHHFDTGTLIPLERTGEGELIKSVGLGWAIPDGMIDEPYFYLSYWSKDPDSFPDNLPSLKAGKWMNPEWNGAVLRLSEILTRDSADGQYELVRSFFNAGIKTTKSL